MFRRKTVEKTETEISSERFGRISAALAGESMRKPVYADCWTVGSRESLRVLESYTMPLGDVTIGIADDGEMEYNLIPKDYGYGRELTEAIGSTIDAVRDRYRKRGGNMDRQSVYASAREELCRVHQDSDDISWTMDGTAIAAGAKSVSLTSGKHTITASYTLTDGTSETLELMVNVQ